MKQKVVLTNSDTAVAVRQPFVSFVMPRQAASGIKLIQSENPKIPHNQTQKTLSQFDELPDSAFVRQPVVLGLLACSKATLWRWVKISRVASPHKIGARISAWNVGQLRESLKEISNSGKSFTPLVTKRVSVSVEGGN